MGSCNAMVAILLFIPLFGYFVGPMLLIWADGASSGPDRAYRFMLAAVAYEASIFLIVIGYHVRLSGCG